MKISKLIFILLILFTHKVYGQIVLATYDPIKPGIGTYIQSTDSKVNTSFLYEIGKYNGNKSMKIGAGASFVFRKKVYKQEFSYINLSICYNKMYRKATERMYLFSLDIGGISVINRYAFSIFIDPYNKECKVGIGFNF